MLDKHLTVKTYGAADKDNIVFWHNYRVTVLDGRLFRIESNADNEWRDRATQSIWFRNAAKQSFETDETGGVFKIITPFVTLVLKENIEDCFVYSDGEKIPLDNNGNLRGTYRTLDCCDGDTKYEDWVYGCAVEGKVILDDGVCSKSGVAVLHDESSLSLDEYGKVIPERGKGKDIYVFAYGNDYRVAVNALYKITGAPPMLPRYALGNWWSRYHAYTADEYLTLLDKFSQRNIPFTVATVDMDWHWSTDLDKKFHITESGKNTDYFGGANGWTGYSWNTELFPDYKLFLREVNDRNYKVTLNVHPADGVRFFEDMYTEMAVACGVNPDTGKRIEFDVTDDNFINNYFSVLHTPYENSGVAFWWIDWQQGEKSKIDGLDPLWSLNHYHFLDNEKSGKKPLILSRYCGVGAHRYPVGFSGDTHATWKTLEYLPYFTATASNIGYTWWSHDIGGHMLGETDGELYLRSVQFGVFSPINRLHCCGSKVVSKEPWNYGNGTGLIAEEFLRFRHRLIPFLYTANYLTHAQGKPLVEPLYYEYASEEAYRYRDEYLFGGLIVAPVTSPIKEDGYARIHVWLPKGKYTDIFTKEEYFIETAGGKEGVLLRKLESIPVLAKAGTVLPLSLDNGNSVKNPEKLEIKVYSGNGRYTLYEDGENGEEYFTDFVLTESGGQVVLDIFGHGDAGIIPRNRTLRICFENIYDGVAEVYCGGKRIDCGKEYFENLTVTVNYEHGTEIRVVAKDRKTAFENMLYRMKKIMTEAEEDVFIKDKWYNEFIRAENACKLEELIVSSELKEVTKTKLKEIFF